MDSTAAGAHDALIQFLYQSPIGLLQTTLDGEITMINPMSARLLMPLVPDGNLENLFVVLAPVVPDLRQRAATALAPGDPICDDLRFEVPGTPGRSATPLQTLALSLVRLGPETLVASVTDVSLIVQREQQHLQSTLKDASRVDALTQLPNRSVVMERIASALASARADARCGFAVIVVNCDRFDRVNVTFGPAVGDELLRLIGARLGGILRVSDGIGADGTDEPSAARLGGDEFVIVVQQMRRSDDAVHIARRVADSLAEPYQVGEHLIHITASVGVFESSSDAEPARAKLPGESAQAERPSGPRATMVADEVLQRANIAMHEAKRAGGARCSVFEASMKDRAARLGNVESELRGAIAAGHLFVVYQPIVALDTGACTGMEALVRWRHPARGVVPPIDFIEIAEETGLICALGSFVLNEACMQMDRWQREFGGAAPGTMSVNVSKAQLRDGNFSVVVKHGLAASRLSAHRLQLEVTESLAGQDEQVRHQLHSLKALGLKVALDDFGTGYSSLSSLHQLPVDVVKIDRSFVTQLESSAHHRVLVEATVKVAKSLGMGTVAEGIETEGQATELTRLGCDRGQGYLFAKPMSPDDASGWLSRHAVGNSVAAAAVADAVADAERSVVARAA